jgi:hypothetical protein
MKKSNLAENLKPIEGQEPKKAKGEVIPIREGIANEVREKTLAKLRDDLRYQQSILNAPNAFEAPQHHKLIESALYKVKDLEKQIKTLEQENN